jgi:hypothetical protein
MALSSYGSQGTTPIGSLITGWLITLGTARLALAVGGGSAIACALVLFLLTPSSVTPRSAELAGEHRVTPAEELSQPVET